MLKEMHSKRWCFHMKIVAVGGRGKRVCKTAEVLSEERYLVRTDLLTLSVHFRHNMGAGRDKIINICCPGL